MKNKDPFKNLVLDDYEKELEASIAQGEWLPMSKKQFEKYKLELQEAAKGHIENRQSMTIRVKKNVISKIKSKAQVKGIPYQTIVNILLSQYADGKIKLAI
ncbi:MAG: hypothetical protein AAB535_01200 [Patescibacteria group bacterium]